MKETFTIVTFILIANLANGKVVIDKNTMIGNNNILDFNIVSNTEEIILPAVTNIIILCL